MLNQTCIVVFINWRLFTTSSFGGPLEFYQHYSLLFLKMFVKIKLKHEVNKKLILWHWHGLGLFQATISWFCFPLCSCCWPEFKDRNLK